MARDGLSGFFRSFQTFVIAGLGWGTHERRPAQPGNRERLTLEAIQTRKNVLCVVF